MQEGTGIVIIDDSAQWLGQLTSAVDAIGGLTVIGTASTPSAAIELVSTLRPPIVVLDLFLLGGSGLDVLKAVAKQNSGTRIVMVTGSPTIRLKQVCMQLGARYFFDKTFEFEELEAALRTLRQEIATRQ